MTNEELKLKIESLRIAEKQSFLYGDLIREAADIIENLSQDLEQEKKYSEFWEEQANKDIEELKQDLEREKEYSAFWEAAATEARAKLQQYALALANASRWWISANEDKPKLDENVIVTDGTNVGMGWRDIFTDRKTGLEYAEWFAPNCKVDDDHITHWMRFPEPPKEKT